MAEFPTPVFQKVERNVYRRNKLRKLNQKEPPEQCTCSFDPKDEENTTCANYSCYNRSVYYECPEDCTVARCKNQRFKRREYISYEIKYFHGRGWGMVASEDIDEDTFVIEYLGEVLSQKDCNKEMTKIARLPKKRLENVMLYYLNIDSELVIDAKHKGGDARFINHSCEPNCHAMAWNIDGEMRVGIFSSQNIKKGEELCYDYGWDTQRDTLYKKKCLCGTAKCTGYIGGARAPAGSILFMEDEEESEYENETRGRKRKRKMKRKRKRKDNGPRLTRHDVRIINTMAESCEDFETLDSCSDLHHGKLYDRDTEKFISGAIRKFHVGWDSFF